MSRLDDLIDLLIDANTDDCIEWPHAKNDAGYGQVKVMTGKPMAYTHRLAYFHETGVWPRSDQFVCHSCDNRPCLNPRHLWLGTQADNMRDMAEKGRAWTPLAEANRAKTHCPKGHPYDGDNLFLNANGRRECRECIRGRGRLRRARNRAASKEVTPSL